MSSEPSVTKLESLCQNTLQQLLDYKENLQKCKNQPNKVLVHPNQSLPFYTSLLHLYQKLKYKDKLLLEINEQIKQKQQEKELKSTSQLAAVLFGDSTEKQKNPLEKWYTEMIKYCRELNADSSADFLAEDRVFYNVSFSVASIQSTEQGELSKLSFSTRCCKKCLMMTIAVKHKNDDDFEIVDCRSSLGFKELDKSLEEALRNNQSAKDFVVLFLWKNIKILNDYGKV